MSSSAASSTPSLSASLSPSPSSVPSSPSSWSQWNYLAADLIRSISPYCEKKESHSLYVLSHHYQRSMDHLSAWPSLALIFKLIFNKRTIHWDLGKRSEISDFGSTKPYLALPPHPLSNILFKYCTEAVIRIPYSSSPSYNERPNEISSSVSLWMDVLYICPIIQQLEIRMCNEPLPIPPSLSLPLPPFPYTSLRELTLDKVLMDNVDLFDLFPSLTTFNAACSKILLKSHSNMNTLSLQSCSYLPLSPPPPLRCLSLNSLSLLCPHTNFAYSSLPSSSQLSALQLHLSYFPLNIFSLFVHKYNNLIIFDCNLCSLNQLNWNEMDLISSLSLLPHLHFLSLRWDWNMHLASPSVCNQLFSHLPSHLISLQLSIGQTAHSKAPPMELDWDQCKCRDLQLLSIDFLLNTTISTEKSGEGLWHALSYFNQLFLFLKGIYYSKKLYLFPLDKEKKVIRYKRLSTFSLDNMCYFNRNRLLGEGDGERERAGEGDTVQWREGKLKCTEQLKYSFIQLFDSLTPQSPTDSIEIPEIHEEWLHEPVSFPFGF